MIGFEKWTVLPHGPWQELAENLWCVQGTLPGAMRGWPRTMTAVRRKDGTVVIHSAIALDEDAMTRLESWGRPTTFIVPNGSHRTDAGVYAKRYPDMKIYCPINNRKNVEEIVQVDGSYDDFPSDETVRAEHLDGVSGWEGVIQVHSADGTTLVFCDVVTWIQHLEEPALSTAGGWMGPKPMITAMARRELVTDGKAFREHLRRLASIPDLVRVIPGHGNVICENPAEALRAIAESV